MFSGRRREETEPVWLGLETRIQQSGAEKIPFLLIAASARCFLSSLAVPGPLQLGTVSIWDVFSARFLFCHASGVLLPSPRTLQTSPPRRLCPVSQHRHVSGFVITAFLFSFGCAVSFWDCHLLNSSEVPEAGIVGTGTYTAVAPAAPGRAWQSFVRVQPISCWLSWPADWLLGCSCKYTAVCWSGSS